MKRQLKKIRRLYRAYHSLDPNNPKNHLIQELGKDHDLIHDAKLLHAKVYLTRNFINPEEINEKGHIDTKFDPYQRHSHYFAASIEEDGKRKVVATARQIEWDKKLGNKSFPILEKAKINTTTRKILLKKDLSKCVEISGLAKMQGTGSEAVLFLYREMWYRSLRDGHDIWLMACDVKLYDRLISLFDGAMQRIGETTSYQGGDVIPAMLSPYEAIEAIIKSTNKGKLATRSFRKRILQFLLEKYPKNLLTPEQKKDIKDLNI